MRYKVVETDRSLLVQLTASYPPRVCGIADYTAHLAAALQERIKEPTQVCVWTGDGEVTANAPSVRRVSSPFWNRNDLARIAGSLREEKPTLIHLQWERAVFQQSAALCFGLPRLLRQANIPLVTTFHALGGPAHWKQAHLAALLPLLYGSKNVVVCSKRQLTALRRLPRIGEKAVLIPVGSVIPVLPDTPCLHDANRSPRLVYFGFVWRGRGLETVLQALHAVRQTGRDATLAIVGGVRDEAYRAELEALATTLKIADAVCWKGELPADDVSRVLGQSDIALLPFASGVSTGRTTLMAALAHGLPVVTFAQEDNVSPLFRDGQNMRLIQRGSDAFVRATRDLVEKPALRTHLARGAKQLSARFSWEHIARQTLDLPAYRSILR